jgi:hypothetical protein
LTLAALNKGHVVRIIMLNVLINNLCVTNENYGIGIAITPANDLFINRQHLL